MEKFNTDLRQVIKWMHNKAPNIQKLINLKYEWYQKYHHDFWTNWERDVFNLDTVNEFGVYVWCEILGIPKEKFVFSPLRRSWAYGPERQNYVYSGMNTSIPVADRNTVGGNFFGAGDDVVAGLEEARIILKLRYMTLTSDGRLASINNMLKFIFNKGDDWDYANSKYVYVFDKSLAQGSPSLVLNVRIQDWQGDWQAYEFRTRTQYGAQNIEMGIKNRGWNFNNNSGTYIGGDNTLYFAPDGTQTAVKLIRNNYTNVTGVFSAATQRTYLNGPKKAFIKSFFLKINRNADGAKKFALSGSGGTAYPSRYFYVDQTASFDFTNGDPVITVTPTNPGSSPYPTDIRYAGWQKFTINGEEWYRIWNVFVTTREYPTGNTARYTDQNLIMTDYPLSATSLNNTIVWGAMLEIRDDDGLPPVPGTFFYCNGSANTLKSQTDYTINQSTKQITFANGANGKPILLAGATATASDNYYGFPIETPYVIATGDGMTRTFNIPEPPGYQPPSAIGEGMEYRFGSHYVFSAQFFNLLSDRSLGILPANAGVPYTVSH